MALQQVARCPRPLLTARCLIQPRADVRPYAVVGSTTFIGKPPAPPDPPSVPGPGANVGGNASPSLSSSFDAHILAELRRNAQLQGEHTLGATRGPAARQTQLPELIEQYVDRSGLVLDASLPYESRPAQERRVVFDAEEEAEASVAMVVHVAENGAEHKITYCSGFALSAPKLAEGQALYVTCAHTLEEIRFNPVVRPLLSTQRSAALPGPSGSFVITGTSSRPTFSPVSSILSSLHRSDLVLLSAASSARPPLRALPVSPYPAHPGTRIRAHFVTNKPPTSGPDAEGWRPWVGGTWSKWVRGSIVGYRDLAGREAKPGTYDALSHMLFDPPPTPGSSGGPIVDEESGAVIGIMLGTQMRNRIEGVSGWGAPSELIFEMFSLPGLKLKNRT
ncbi:uncharacterized protein C8Q71DRAFT_93504 [Rhodofomes roseus]|uniref:Trypsin-like peptidase n=1 Tax=Rhodofomes roseus TaxID=34475 RepID=A0ABQ8KDN2_9APHY|nr:uncharacterized protein C8Q71DRAFT_93504 [Rhodofomes roseus]KAH9835732.1 hypothetical protein C8Q71DRAFT_93504 [Rhodofomes roseus]